MSSRLVLVAPVLALIAAEGVARADGQVMLGPAPYVRLSDSPFDGTVFTYLHIETMEDGVFNLPGVTKSGGSPQGPGGLTDSVDADDGVVDGSGTTGRSLFGNPGSTGIRFTFDAAARPGPPTHAGVVWTDGAGLIRFEAFDAGGISLGVITGNHADGGTTGTTAEDRFYGIANGAGIGSIKLSNSSGGIEMDHIQFGRRACPWIGAQPQPVRICASGEATLSVGAVGVGTLHYQWRHFGIEISGANGASYTIASARSADVGEYDCVVSNDCGSETTVTVDVQVCYADTNCDGQVDFADYLEFLNFYDAQDARADFNEDGLVDFSDYLEFLNRYDAGC